MCVCVCVFSVAVLSLQCGGCCGCFFWPQGLRNDLKAAMDKIDQQYLNEIVGGTESGDVDSQHDLKVHEENTTIEELEVRFCVEPKTSMVNVICNRNPEFLKVLFCSHGL